TSGPATPLNLTVPQEQAQFRQHLGATINRIRQAVDAYNSTKPPDQRITSFAQLANVQGDGTVNLTALANRLNLSNEDRGVLQTILTQSNQAGTRHAEGVRNNLRVNNNRHIFMTSGNRLEMTVGQALGFIETKLRKLKLSEMRLTQKRTLLSQQLKLVETQMDAVQKMLDQALQFIKKQLDSRG
ncbi:MAG: hypothetical protein KC475_12825, partial [Cyanobacteria bacterium HKST-UBA03]|nr:hypothetical protein [Cyanobacteria bacterium HKST-UBA03]